LKNKDNKNLVEIFFEHNKTNYTARVLKHSPTAIVLPDKTVLLTNCCVHVSGPKRSNDKERVRQIFDGEGNLIPQDLLHRPGDWEKPIMIRFPLVFAKLLFK
jgi:hypothetical protein